MTRVLIAFYSRYGTTARLAEAIAEGARAGGASEVRLRRARDLAPAQVIERNERWVRARRELEARYPEPTLDDLEWADAIVLGSPTRFGNMSAELKLLIDSASPLWARGALIDKVGAVFTTSSTPHGGQETTLLSMYLPLIHLGMIVVTPGYAAPIQYLTGNPYGASSVSGLRDDQPPREEELEAARFLGHRVTTIAARLRAHRAATGERVPSEAGREAG